MEYRFSSSFFRFGDPTAPEIIIITDELVTWKKNRSLDWLYLYSDSVSMARKNIDTVIIHSKIIGASIQINGYGMQSIYANHFTGGDAKAIRKILLSNRV